LLSILNTIIKIGDSLFKSKDFLLYWFKSHTWAKMRMDWFLDSGFRSRSVLHYEQKWLDF